MLIFYCFYRFVKCHWLVGVRIVKLLCYAVSCCVNQSTFDFDSAESVFCLTEALLLSVLTALIALNKNKNGLIFYSLSLLFYI